MGPQAVFSSHISRACSKYMLGKHPADVSCDSHPNWILLAWGSSGNLGAWNAFLNWTTVLARRSCFMLIPEAYHSLRIWISNVWFPSAKTSGKLASCWNVSNLEAETRSAAPHTFLGNRYWMPLDWNTFRGIGGAVVSEKEHIWGHVFGWHWPLKSIWLWASHWVSLNLRLLICEV